MANYTTVQDDRSHLDREHDKRSMNYNAPLSQGRTYLHDRSKMCKSLRKNLKLIEGFQDQTGTNKNVVAGLTHATDKDNIQFRKPVLDENAKELSEIMAMQNSINDVKTELTSRVQDFIVQAKGQNTAHQACLKKCNDQTDVDSKSACQYGCNVGYFANQGPNVRRMGNAEGNKLAPPAAAVLAEVFSGVALSAVGGALGLGATIDLASEGFQGREGFEPGAPSTTGGGNPNVGNDTSAVMGTYGTTGYGKQLIGDDSNIQRALGGRKINTLLGNVPIPDDGTAVPGQPGSGDRFGKVDGYKLFSGYEYHNMSPEQSLQQYPNSDAGLRAQAINTATVRLSKQLESGPLVDRMAAANLSATNLGNYMTQLRSQWKSVFQKACAYGIGGVQGSGGAKFAGHTQHCKSWTNTTEGRSGYYSQRNPNNPSYSNPGPKGTPYTVNKEGQMQEFLGAQTNLANQPPLGCDTVIPGTRKNESAVGGSGFCECADGTFRYADTGHPSFTCNQACAPENSSVTKNTPLYHNSNNWKPGLSYIGNQEGFQGRREGMSTKPDAGCPPGMPYMREYGNSGQYYCYENPDGNKTGQGNVCSCQCGYPGPDGKGVCNQNQKPCGEGGPPCPPKPPSPPPVVHNTKLPGGAAALAAKGSPFLQCGTLSKKSNGTYVQGKAPSSCPNGMISYPQQPGVKGMTQCGSKSWGSEKRHCDAFLGDWWCTLFNTWHGVDRSAGDIVNQGRLCIYPEPKGYNKAEVNVIGKLKKLPTAQQLADTCSGGSSPDAPYGNMKLDLLEIKVLGLVLLKKSAILYEAIQQAYSGSNAAALKRSVEGRQILKNLSKYKQAYKAIRIQKNQNLLLQGMLEDSNLKRGATNISYYLWFALAIAGAGLVVKKINN